VSLKFLGGGCHNRKNRIYCLGKGKEVFNCLVSNYIFLLFSKLLGVLNDSGTTGRFPLLVGMGGVW
jgi:hypothetical protein